MFPQSFQMFAIVLWMVSTIEGGGSFMGQITTKPNTHPSYPFWLVTPSNNDHRRQMGHDHGAGVSRVWCSSWLSRWPVKEPQEGPHQWRKQPGAGKTGIISVAQVVMGGWGNRFCQEVLVCADLGPA